MVIVVVVMIIKYLFQYMSCLLLTISYFANRTIF
jgi:hypothetical protein